MNGWEQRRFLIAVRTYPVPAQSGIEVSCTAAITDDQKWMRLFPIPYRFLDADKRFKKYQWVNAKVRKAANDSRPESFNLDIDSIDIESFVASDDGWEARKQIIHPLRSASLCGIQRERDKHGFPTLGIFRPASITRLKIEHSETDWTPKQQNILSQQLLPFLTSPNEKLERIPFNFSYDFVCEEQGCRGHSLTCTDWEMGEAYRKWRNQYGDKWEEKFRQRFEIEMQSRFDTHFFVGNLHQFPNAWIIVGLFYPPKNAQVGMFDG